MGELRTVLGHGAEPRVNISPPGGICGHVFFSDTAGCVVMLKKSATMDVQDCHYPRRVSMTNQARILFLLVSGFATLAALPAQALSMSECSAKYKAAQTAGTLNGQKWNDFRKAQCGSEATATPAAAPAAAPAPAAPKAAEAKPKPAAAPAAAPAPMGNVTFPSAVDPKYAKESAGKARMHTCVDQYNANKTSNGNGGMKWIEKGGGYYSECNKKLKG
jgi:hypothetical protein